MILLLKQLHLPAKNDLKQIVYGWINLFDSMNIYFIFHFESNRYFRYETVDINVAVATDAGVLLTPIVYNADQKVHLNRCFSLK